MQVWAAILDIIGLDLVDINIYMETLSRFVGALEALQSTE
jgi:hypothetical protein